MADTRGTWSLSESWAEKSAAEWVPIPKVWVKETVTKPNAGWLGGGYYKKLAKISFDTDTKTQYGYNWEWSSPTTFYAGGNRAAGTAGASHGYFSGGSNTNGWPSPNYTSYMTKLVYATGVPLTSPSNTISANRSFHVGVSAEEHGYLLGGSTHPSSLPYDSTSDTKLSIVDKITNSTDTAERIPAADLPSAQTKKAMSASAANPSFAYMSGGITPIVSTAARFTYSTETVTQAPSANNLTARSYHSSSSNGSTNFYWHGGGTTNKTIADATPAVNYMTKSTEKTVIATDTTSAIPAEGDTIYCSRGTTGNSLAAYTFGGGTPYGITYQSDKMTYSNETKAASPSLNLQASYGWSDISPVKGLGTTGLTGDLERWFDGATGSNSVEFDGSGDYLTYDDQSPYPLRNWWDQAWTIEYWIKADAFGQSANGGSNVVGSTNLSTTGEAWSFGPEENGEVQWYYWNGSVITVGSGKTLNTGQWYHLAFVFDGDTGMKIFVDGTLEKSASVTGTPTGSSATFSIGRITGSGNDFDGIVSNLRITHAEVYSSNFTPTGPLTEITNTKFLGCNQSTTTGVTVSPGSLTANGDPTVVESQVIGIVAPPVATPTASTTIMGPSNLGYAVDFDGSDDALNIPDNDAWYPETNYTAECWFNCTNHSGGWDAIFGQWPNSNVNATNCWILEYVNSDDELRFYYLNDGASEISYKSLGTVSSDAWHHFAFSKEGSTTRLFIDGVQVVDDFDIGSLQNGNGEFTIGGDVASAGWFDGKISNVRITKGQALYTSNFTVTTEPLTTTSQGAIATAVKLLCCNQATATGSTVTPGTISAVSSPTASRSSSLTEPRAAVRLEGYLGKGRHPAESNDGRTDVYKFSYSTETWSSSVSGTVPVARKFPGATSNTTRGYWAGGSPGTNSQVTKFVWSTNTGSTIPAQLGSARGYMSSAAGNETQGYFAFGYGDTDACDKLDYSSETMSNLPSMPWNTSRAVAMSMQTHGYYGSGAGGDDKGSYFCKITFATDTKSGQIPGWRAHSSGGNMFRSGSSSNTKAYVCSGESTTTSVEVTPWATDSVSQLPSSFMPAQVTGITGQGDNTNAYFTGGPSYSHTQRIVYSSDTVSVLPGANFPAGNVNAYGAGGPAMNGIAESLPNII